MTKIWKTSLTFFFSPSKSKKNGGKRELFVTLFPALVFAKLPFFLDDRYFHFYFHKFRYPIPLWGCFRAKKNHHPHLKLIRRWDFDLILFHLLCLAETEKTH